MNSLCLVYSTQYKCRITCKFLLVLVWPIGLLLGSFVVSKIPLDTFSLMRSSFDSARSSIVVFLLILSLPLLFSVISVVSNKPLLMLPVLFIKALLFSVCWFTLYKAFGSAGWLISIIALFPEFIALFLTILYLLRNIKQKNRTHFIDYLVSQVIILIIGFVEFTVIYPIWDYIISI